MLSVPGKHSYQKHSLLGSLETDILTCLNSFSQERNKKLCQQRSYVGANGFLTNIFGDEQFG